MRKASIIIMLALLVAGTAFAEGLTEIASTESKSAPMGFVSYDALVDLSAGTSSSELVSAAFNKDGNLEVTYKGTDPIVIGITGQLEGTLIVKSDNSAYTLALDNVTITGKELPAVQLKSTTDATLYLVDRSRNTISDSSNNSKKGAITSSGNITVEGTGNLNVEVFKKHGIKLDGGLTINSGNVYIHGDELAEGNMISADNWFIMNGGNLTILAEGNVHATESKGIKVNGAEGAGAGLGFVEINGGYIDITSVGKAITAGWKLAEDATTEDTSDDPIPNVYINGGEIHILTTGTPYEYSDEESLSPEGIEAKDTLEINGGYIYAVTNDDTLNTGNAMVINGGYIYARSTANDSIDSNGTIAINGGIVITMSSSNEQAFDCDNDTRFTYTGGIYVGAGNGNNMPKGEGTTAYSLAYGNRTFYAGDQIAVLDSEQNVVMGFVVPYEVPYLTSIVFGSENFKEGESYTIAVGAFQTQPSDGLAFQGATFRAREEVVTMDMTDYSVSEGYIGMNIGTDFGMGGFGPGGFGGQKGNRGGFDNRNGFDGNFNGNFDPQNMPNGMPQGDWGQFPDGMQGMVPGSMPPDMAQGMQN